MCTPNRSCIMRAPFCAYVRAVHALPRRVCVRPSRVYMCVYVCVCVCMCSPVVRMYSPVVLACRVFVAARRARLSHSCVFVCVRVCSCVFVCSRPRVGGRVKTLTFTGGLHRAFTPDWQASRWAHCCVESTLSGTPPRIVLDNVGTPCLISDRSHNTRA